MRASLDNCVMDEGGYIPLGEVLKQSRVAIQDNELRLMKLNYAHVTSKRIDGIWHDTTRIRKGLVVLGKADYDFLRDEFQRQIYESGMASSIRASESLATRSLFSVVSSAWNSQESLGKVRIPEDAIKYAGIHHGKPVYWAGRGFFLMLSVNVLLPSTYPLVIRQILEEKKALVDNLYAQPAVPSVA